MEIKSYLHTISDLDMEGRRIIGYASKTEVLDRDGEIIERGAFQKTAKERGPRGSNEVKFFWQHERKKPLGKILDLYEDSVGLYSESYLSKTSLGNDALELIKDGVLDSFSIGFYPLREGKKNNKRAFKEVVLDEISLVTIPANPHAKITDLKSYFNIENVESAYRNGRYENDDTFLFLKGILDSIEEDPLTKLVNDIGRQPSGSISDILNRVTRY